MGLLDDPTLMSNFHQASDALQLTPQEQALYRRHLENLWGSGGVDHPDGHRSTLYQAVEEKDGRYYSIPTVWDGRIVEPEEARRRVEKEGWSKFPSYGTPEEADARYGQMHDYFDRDTQDYFAVRSPLQSLMPGLLGKGVP